MLIDLAVSFDVVGVSQPAVQQPRTNIVCRGRACHWAVSRGLRLLPATWEEAPSSSRGRPGATFPDGTLLTFPTPHLTTGRYDLDDVPPELVKEITSRVKRSEDGALPPESLLPRNGGGVPRGHAERPAPVGHPEALRVLWCACLLTIRRILAAHLAFIEARDAGYVLDREALDGEHDRILLRKIEVQSGEARLGPRPKQVGGRRGQLRHAPEPPAAGPSLLRPRHPPQEPADEVHLTMPRKPAT